MPGCDNNKLDEPAMVHQRQFLVDQYPNIPWAVDPDIHCNALIWFFHMALITVAPLDKPLPRTSCIFANVVLLLAAATSVARRAAMRVMLALLSAAEVE